MEFLFKLQTGKVREAVCVSPKITGLFNSDLDPSIQTNLNYKLEVYCKSHPTLPKSIGDTILAKLDIGKVINQNIYIFKISDNLFSI